MARKSFKKKAVRKSSTSRGLSPKVEKVAGVGGLSPKVAKKSGGKMRGLSPKSSSKSGGRRAAERDRILERIYDDVWPVERKVRFNPDRLIYVRKLIKPKGCVFCSAAEAGTGPASLLLYKGENAIVVLNKYPYNTGHLLVLPRRHCGEFLDLTDAEQLEMNRCLQMSIGFLQDAYQPSGFNVGLNLGSAAGAGIPEHLHYHVIPRWSGDTNFFALIAETKVVVETLEQTYERLLPYFEGAKA